MVKAEGDAFVPETGYYSTRLAMTVRQVTPVGSCDLKPVPVELRDTVAPKVDLQNYRVLGTYQNQIFDALVTDLNTGNSLKGWRNYATVMENGAKDVFRVFCADGFVLEDSKSISGSGIQPEDLFIPRNGVTFLDENGERVEFAMTCRRQPGVKERPAPIPTRPPVPKPH